MKSYRLFLLLLVAVASASARAATEKIRIMSYNIPMGNILVTDGNGRNTWENRCAVIHQYLTDVAPDLLGMQEPVRQELCDILRGIPNYAMVGTARNALPSSTVFASARPCATATRTTTWKTCGPSWKLPVLQVPRKS